MIVLCPGEFSVAGDCVGALNLAPAVASPTSLTAWSNALSVSNSRVVVVTTMVDETAQHTCPERGATVQQCSEAYAKPS